MKQESRQWDKGKFTFHRYGIQGTLTTTTTTTTNERTNDDRLQAPDRAYQQVTWEISVGGFGASPRAERTAQKPGFFTTDGVVVRSAQPNHLSWYVQIGPVRSGRAPGFKSTRVPCVPEGNTGEGVRWRGHERGTR